MGAKRKSLTEDELAAAVAGQDGDDTPPVPAVKNRAVCHPSRLSFADGWCEKCYAKRRALSPQDLDGKVNNELAVLVRTNKELEKIHNEAKLVLENNLRIYAELHMKAAQKAADRGDSRPIEWALQHIANAGGKTVVPSSENEGGGGGGGMKVLINIPLGGLPTPTAPVIDVQKKA